MCNSGDLEEKINDQSPNDIISGLIGKILSPSHHSSILQIIDNTALQPSYIMEKLQHEFIFCWIERDAIINNINYHFQYKLFFHHNSILYIYKFKTSFKNIEYLHKHAYNDPKHFAVQTFPKGTYIHH